MGNIFNNCLSTSKIVIYDRTTKGKQEPSNVIIHDSCFRINETKINVSYCGVK